ncbi:two-component system response regulator [Erysipelothrix larvae]|uniref:Two-component system response regulator n=1 Tax=Erysipelothrix larvae TaxID=1514105 RepID=A0A0X8GYH6_9FIRM|nr:response regulator transcription factor [Erysipelothrix larvae]AMC92564.1 two-component system response regulator [Erysipelothrix larvae]
MTKILYLEDDPIIREVTLEYLLMKHYDVDVCCDGQEALDCINTTQYSCAILDILVPVVSGFDVLKSLSTLQKDCAVIMLSALDDEKSQLEAFNNFADDYIIKPFSPLLLLKRIEAVLRRSKSHPFDASLTVSKEGYQVFYNHQSLNLTVTEFLIFDVLYTSPTQVFSREQLLNVIAPDDFMVSDRVIDAHIKNLRKKLPLSCIKTVVGLGYQFKGPAL